MQFLGNLGIDVNLLVAQIINFAILCWLLAYFVYKPSIKIIEENEADLARGRALREAALKEKISVAEALKKEKAEAQATGRAILEEAKTASGLIQSQVYEKTRTESAKILAQTKNTLEMQKPLLAEEISNEVKAKFMKGFKHSFAALIDEKYQEEVEAVLFKNFIEQIENASLDKLARNDTKELKKLQKGDVKVFERKLLTIVGPILLEYAIKMPANAREHVEKVVADKIGFPIKVQIHHNKELINGFRLEIQGRLIESNFSHIVEHAEKF